MLKLAIHHLLCTVICIQIGVKASNGSQHNYILTGKIKKVFNDGGRDKIQIDTYGAIELR